MALRPLASRLRPCRLTTSCLALALAGCGARTSIDLDAYEKAPADAAVESGADSSLDSGRDAPKDVAPDKVPTDVGPDAKPCGPASCSGCCFGAECRPGTTAASCGAYGQTCQDCASQGLACDPSAHVCTPSPTCGPGTCSGCCSTSSYPPVCRPGTSAAECGSYGQACQSCAGPGQVCQPKSPPPGGTCTTTSTCDSTTCQGCCESGVCRSGDTNTQCGVKAQPCKNCSANGQICNPSSGVCQTVANCGPSNCKGCCTSSGTCLDGQSDTRCGQGGTLCENCTSSGEACVDGKCQGLTNCPASYGGCPGYLSTPPPTTSLGVCPQADLAAMQAACTGNPTPPTCWSWFVKEQSSNPACYGCVYQFGGADAYAKCLAPYISSSCNHQLSCAIDCVIVACSQCDEAHWDACQSDVFSGGGACAGYLQGLYCIQGPLSGPAAFCDTPGDTGAWLRAVGNHYCGTGSP